MKRAVIVLVLASALAVVFIWQANTTVQTYARERLPYAESAQAYLQQSDFITAQEIIVDLQNLWRSDRRRLAIYINHSHLDVIQQHMESILAACAHENDDAAAYCATLIDLLAHLPDMNRMWIENFL